MGGCKEEEAGLSQEQYVKRGRVDLVFGLTQIDFHLCGEVAFKSQPAVPTDVTDPAL